jgi:DNA-binding response OmpR family regulator
VGKYELDLNERALKFDQNKLSLTEMEANVILFLMNSNEPVNIKKLQEKVWGHMSDLETHTVETHIYRLRKKIKDTFQDNDFIISLKNGYQIV